MKEKEKKICHICQKSIIGSSYKFKSHLYSHRAIKPCYKCTYCCKEYFRKDMFVAHLKKHTGDIKKSKYVCDHCDRSFVEKRNLVIHLKIHDDFNMFQYKCMACGVNYCEERLLKYHIRKVHFNLHDKESIHVKKELNETWVERVKESEVCVQMTKVNNNVITIKRLGVIKDEIDKKPEHNDAKTKFKEYITSVFARTDKSQYSQATCDYCKKEMLKKSLLSHIRERHLKLRRFKCEDCKSTFKRHYQMVNHICGKFKPKMRNK